MNTKLVYTDLCSHWATGDGYKKHNSPRHCDRSTIATLSLPFFPKLMILEAKNAHIKQHNLTGYTIHFHREN